MPAFAGGKGKVVIRLMKYHVMKTNPMLKDDAMETYRGADVQLQAFLTSELDRGG
jgi:hypothetical protein